MHSGEELPLVDDGATLQQLLVEMSSKKARHGRRGGRRKKNFWACSPTATLRRALEREVDVYRAKAVDLMTPKPFTIAPDMLAAEIVKVMRDFAQRGPHAVNSVFVVDAEGRAVGALNTHDLLKAGVI